MKVPVLHCSTELASPGSNMNGLTHIHTQRHINLFTRTDSGEIQIAVQNEFPQQ